MIYWKYVDWGQFILQEWADRADKTLNEFVTDRGKYDLGFGRDFDGSELWQFNARACWYAGGDHDSIKYVWFDQLRVHDKFFIWFSFMLPIEICEDSVKYVWYDEFRLHQHYKGGYEICKDWEELDKYGL